MGSNAASSQIFNSTSLADNYRIIGRELSKWYEHRNLYSRSSRLAMDDFRVGIACVTTSALEAFLDDLLDPDVPEDRLGLGRMPWRVNPYSVLLSLAIASGAGLLYSFAFEVSLLGSFVVAALIGMMLAGAWQFTPSAKLARRMSFAQLVAQEVARRRGDSDKHFNSDSLLSFVRLLTPQREESSSLSASPYLQ